MGPTKQYPIKPLTPNEIRGNSAALTCPSNRNATLDIHRLAAEIDAMIDLGVNGMCSNVACHHPGAAQR